MARSAAPAISVPNWLRRRLDLWLKRLDLDSWHVQIIMIPHGKNDKKGGETTANTSWARGYHDARMEFSVEYYNSASPALVDRQLVHELYHLIAAREDDAIEKMVGTTGTVYKAYTDEQELIAEAFAHLMIRVYQRKRAT